MKSQLFLFILVFASQVSFAKGFPGFPRMSFSEVEDSLLTSPQKVFEEYCNDLSEYDSKLSMPAGFHPVDMRPVNFFIAHSPCFPSIPQSRYPLALEADNGEAALLFPELFFDFGNETLRRGLEIESEIRTMHGDCDLDVNPYVEIYDVRKQKGYANADTVAFYEFDLDSVLSPYVDTSRFKHCVGVYLRAKRHPALMLKIIMNDEGYAKKDDYIRTLLDNIEFGEGAARLTMIEWQLEGVYTDLGFPSIYRHPYKAQPQMDQLPDKSNLTE